MMIMQKLNTQQSSIYKSDQFQQIIIKNTLDMNVNNRFEILESLICLFKNQIIRKVQQIQIKLQLISVGSHSSNNQTINSQTNSSANSSFHINHQIEKIQRCKIIRCKNYGQKQFNTNDQIDLTLRKYVQKLAFDEQTKKINFNISRIIQQMQSNFFIQQKINQKLQKELKQHILIDQSIHQKLNLIKNKVQTLQIKIGNQNQKLKVIQEQVNVQQLKCHQYSEIIDQIQLKTNNIQQECLQYMNKKRIQHIQSINYKLQQVQQRILEGQTKITALSKQHTTIKQQINTNLARLEQNQKEQNNQIQNMFNYFNTQKNQCDQDHKKCLALIQALKNESLEDFSTNYRKFKVMKWSPQLKGTHIKITGSVAEKINSDGSQFALIGHCLPFNNNKTCWAIHLTKIKTCYSNSVLLGISLKNLTAKANYLLRDYTKIGHGHYLLGSGEYAYSHSDVNYNNVNKKSFSFVQGDTIFMEFDSENKILRFRRNHSAEKFQFNVVAQANDSYYPSVYIYGVGQSASLVYGQPLS